MVRPPNLYVTLTLTSSPALTPNSNLNPNPNPNPNPNKAYTSLLGTVVVDGAAQPADGPHGTAIVATHAMPATDLAHSDAQRAAEVQRIGVGLGLGVRGRGRGRG